MFVFIPSGHKMKIILCVSVSEEITSTISQKHIQGSVLNSNQHCSRSKISQMDNIIVSRPLTLGHTCAGTGLFCIPTLDLRL